MSQNQNQNPVTIVQHFADMASVFQILSGKTDVLRITLKDFGDVIAKAVDQFGRVALFNYLIENKLGFSRQILSQFEGVGRGSMDVRLIEMDGPGPNKLKKLPIKIQQEVLSEGVYVWDPQKQGDHLYNVNDLEPTQARMVFSSTGVRTQSEQRRWLDEQALENAIKSTPEVDMPYHIEKNCLVIPPSTSGIKITHGEVVRILQAMVK